MMPSKKLHGKEHKSASLVFPILKPTCLAIWTNRQPSTLVTLPIFPSMCPLPKIRDSGLCGECMLARCISEHGDFF